MGQTEQEDQEEDRQTGQNGIRWLNMRLTPMGIEPMYFEDDDDDDDGSGRKTMCN